MRKYSDKKFFVVGEYWILDVNNFKDYMNECGNCMSLFDVLFYYNFYFVSNLLGNFDMRKLIDNIFLKVNLS